MKTWIAITALMTFAQPGGAFAVTSAPGSSNAGLYSSTLKLLVYTGITDAGTLNHNLRVYQKILRNIDQTAARMPVRPKKTEAFQARDRILLALSDVQNRIQAQLEYVPESLVSTVMGDVWTAFGEAQKSARSFQFKKVSALSRVAIQELETSKIDEGGK